MNRKLIYSILASVMVMTSCMKESLSPDMVVTKEPLVMDKIQYTLSQSSMEMGYSAGADTLMLTFTVPGSNQATKASIESEGKEARYTCHVSVDDHKAGHNPMGSTPSLSTKSIYGQNSTNAIPCNFLRLDENYDSDHTALYTFPTYNHATVLEGEVNGAPESSDFLRSITLKPEQKYNFYSNADKDSIFYHTRLVGWHPVVCKLPASGTPVEFGDNRYSNYLALIGNKYGIVFDHALDGGTDIMISNLGQAQRWHSNGAPAPGKRDNRYRDLAKQILDTNYCTPFGYNSDQPPHYSNPMQFKHFLSAVRIWAKVAQDTASTLNLSTWGKILSLSFVDQPSTCTVMFPEKVGNDSFGTLLEDSWTDYTNHLAQCGLIYGEGDISIPLEDEEVKYPIDMTQAQAEMSKKYLGYCLVMPGQDITIAIQTSAGTYQAVLPHKVLLDGASDPTSIFQGGMIYDIVLNLDTKGSVAEFIENEDTGTYIDLSPWDPSPDKQEFKTANCYMVDVKDVSTLLSQFTSAGSEDVPGYCFLGTVIGNGDAGIISKGITGFHTDKATISPTGAKLIWQSENGLITNVHLQHGYIRFNVPKAHKGNAVIAAVDEEGTVLWSWHIWITDTPEVITSSKNYNYMDRNLGAITTTDGDVIANSEAEALKLYGLYYQWGRKDPMPMPLKYNQSGGQSMRITPVYNTYGEKVTSMGTYIYNQGETIVDAIEKPMHYLINPSSPYYNYNWMSDKIDFLWGEEVSGASGSSYYQKTIYDPCPYGYHVPGEEIQYLAETADTIISNNQYGLIFEKAHPIFLPYAGYYGPDRNQSSNDGAAYYCGSKGDYQSSVICSDEDGVDYSYFRNHRLRTYISSVTSWTEMNTDGKSAFPYNAPYHFVTTDEVKTHHDYTNRRTAASVRCIKETNYELNIVSRMSLSTQSVSATADTPVTFTFDGRTNKGVISSATLVIHYTKDSDGKDETWLSQNLSTVGTAVLTSKTVTGYFTVTIPKEIVLAARENEVYAHLDLVVTQGTAKTSRSSVEYLMKDGFVLTIKVNSEQYYSSALLPAYCIDATEEFSVLLPGGTTETRTTPTTRLVKRGTAFYPPVIGQPTTVTVYVNAVDATVTIDGTNATVDASGYKDVGDDRFYPYSVTKKTWSSKGEKQLAVAATKDGYGTAEETVSVPVYGIKVSTSKINGESLSRNAVTTDGGIVKNWYMIMDKLKNITFSESSYSLYFNGLNIKWNESGTADNYRYLFGFETPNSGTKIFNAMSGISCPFVEGGENKLVVASTLEGGQTFYPSAYTTGWLTKTYYIHIKTVNSDDSEYWGRLTYFAEYKIDTFTSGLYAGRFWWYPVSFSLE